MVTDLHRLCSGPLLACHPFNRVKIFLHSARDCAARPAGVALLSLVVAGVEDVAGRVFGAEVAGGVLRAQDNRPLLASVHAVQC